MHPGRTRMVVRPDELLASFYLKDFDCNVICSGSQSTQENNTAPDILSFQSEEKTPEISRNKNFRKLKSKNDECHFSDSSENSSKDEKKNSPIIPKSNIRLQKGKFKSNTQESHFSDSSENNSIDTKNEPVLNIMPCSSKSQNKLENYPKQTKSKKRYRKSCSKPKNGNFSDTRKFTPSSSKCDLTQTNTQSRKLKYNTRKCPLDSPDSEECSISFLSPKNRDDKQNLKFKIEKSSNERNIKRSRTRICATSKNDGSIMSIQSSSTWCSSR